MSTASSPSEFDESFPDADLVLPEGLRSELAKPIGTFVPVHALAEHTSRASKLVSVGDIVTITLLQEGLEPDVAVFDYRTQRSDEADAREKISRMSGTLVKVDNPPGRITKALWDAVRDAVNSVNRVKIEVSGEEDLAALVAIVNCPVGAQVIYGIPNKGLMVVDVNDDTRSFASAAIKKMIR